MSQIIYKDLSYKIIGIVFEVHNKLGGSFEEKYYQRALEIKLVDNNLKFTKELKVDLFIDKHAIGKYYLDFLIEDKIILELKTVPQLLPAHFRQVKSYLKAKQLKLGILANMRGEKVNYSRILNSLASE